MTCGKGRNYDKNSNFISRRGIGIEISCNFLESDQSWIVLESSFRLTVGKSSFLRQLICKIIIENLRINVWEVRHLDQKQRCCVDDPW